MYSQNNAQSRDELITKHQKNVNACRGTYQIQMINTRSKAVVPYTIYETVEANRHETDTIYKMLYPNVKLMILPSSVIKKEDFIRVEEYKYIQE